MEDKFLILIFNKEAKVGIKKSGEEGFSLVELAIVLVIIGIIIGAVVKGQDLIDNARAKKVTTALSTWNILAWTFMDRKGRLPGAGGANNDGIIGNEASEVAAAGTSIAEIVSGVGGAGTTMANPPANPIVVGSASFWIYFGYDSTGGAINKSVMVACGVANCGTAFTADQLKTIETIDTAIDGIADAGFGQVRGATAAPTGTYGLAAQNGRANGVVTAITATDETPAGATAVWATTHFAAVWLFDKPY